MIRRRVKIFASDNLSKNLDILIEIWGEVDIADERNRLIVAQKMPLNENL